MAKAERRVASSQGEAEVIPVSPKSEPRPPVFDFDAKVRKPGVAWLTSEGIPMSGPIPKGKKAPPYWRACLPHLHHEYGGICAYLCVYVERCSGGVSVDHYVAKSNFAGHTYEWSNYRLASATMNARKRDYSTVLDPFTLTPGTFQLELITGHIFVKPGLPPAARTAAQATIDRLNLDRPCREMRARHYTQYLALRGANSRPNPAAIAWLRSHSPFVFQEAQRQGVL